MLSNSRSGTASRTRLVLLRTWAFICAIFLALLPGLGAARGANPASPPPALIEHTPVTQYARGAAIEIQARIIGEADGVNFYFRYEGIAVFQVRPLLKAGAGTYSLRFDTSLLPAPSFEYYLESYLGSLKTQSPPGAPQQLYKANGQGEAAPTVPQDIPTPQAEEARFRLPVNVTGNGVLLISRKQERAGAAQNQANGNFQTAVQVQPAGRWGMSIDSNFAYAGAPLPGMKPFNLSNMMVTLTLNSHSLKAGDLNFNESEYTVYGLGRRGLDYTFDNQKLYLRAFTASTQQVTGFAGFGFPGPETRIFGGAAGYKFFQQALCLKAVYVSGKDNPGLGFNVGVPSAFSKRQGDVAALIEETHLFQQAVNLRAEFASSRYDGDLTDERGRVEDQAYQFGGDVRLGGFTAGGRYKHIGRNFNSVGLMYLANDRKGWEATAGYMRGIVSLQGMYSREQDNVKNDPDRATTRSDNGQVAGTLTLSSKIVLNGGFRLNDQTMSQGGPAAQLQDGRTREFSGGASWMPSLSASMNCTVIQSQLSSKNNPGLNNRALTVNAGGCFRAGETLTLSPAASWSRSVYSSLGTTTNSGSGNLTLELWLVRQVFSVAIFGTGSRSEMPGVGRTHLLDLTAALNFQLGNLLKLGTLALSLKGNYNHQNMAGQKITDTRVYVQGDMALSL